MGKDTEKPETRTENTGGGNMLNDKFEILIELAKSQSETSNRLMQTVEALLKTQIETKERIKRQCLDARLCERIEKSKCNKKKEYKLRSETTTNGWNYYPFDGENRANFIISCEKQGGYFVVRYIEKTKRDADASGVVMCGNTTIIGKYPVTQKDDVRYLFDLSVAKLNATMGERNGFYIKG